MVIDQFKIGHPKRVRHALQTYIVEVIPQSKYKLGISFTGKLTHTVSYCFLIVIPIATLVGDDKEVKAIIASLSHLRECPLGRYG